MADPRELLDPVALDQRDAAAATVEVELAVLDAQLRAREAMLAALRGTLAARAQLLDQRERDLRERLAVDGLAGLGAGSAQADVAVDLDRAAMLHLGRAQLVAAREAWLSQRRQALNARFEELDRLDAGLQQATARLDAREQRVLDAANAPQLPPRQKGATDAGLGRPLRQPELPPVTQPLRALPRHASTEPMPLLEAEAMVAPVRPRPVGPPRTQREVRAPILLAVPHDLPDAPHDRRAVKLTVPMVRPPAPSEESDA